MKQYILSVCLLVTGLALSQEQGFEKQWEQIDSLELQGQVYSASLITEEVLAQAREKKDFTNFLKAKIFYYKFYQINHENSNNFILADVNSSLTELPVPFWNVLQSYKAGILQQYYNKNRWKIRDRGQIDDPDAGDLETWSAAALQDSIRSSYDRSLENEKLLVRSAAEIIDELILESPLSRKYRPSLYDLLAYRALEYYSDPANFPPLRPELEYAFTSEVLYAPTDEFLQLEIKAPEPSSASKVLQTYKRLELLHKSRKNAQAKVYAQLARLDYVNSNFRGPGKWELYSAALEALSEEYRNKEVSSLVLLAQAKLLLERAEETDAEGKLLHPDFLKQAVVLCDRIIEEFPNSDSFQNAHRLRAVITTPQIDAKLPEVLAGGEAGRLFVSYKSIDSLRLRTFRVPETGRGYIPYHQRDSLVARILKRQALKDTLLLLPQAEDYNRHSTEYVLEGLDPGTYFIHLTGTETSGTKGYSYAYLKVSNLVFSETRFQDHNLYQVLDRSSGEVVSGVQMRFFDQDDNLRFTSLTNAEGRVLLKGRPNGWSGKVQLIKQNDTLSSYFHRFSYGFTEEEETPQAKTMLYLDRHIYRPGQTVYFKGVLLKRDKQVTTAVPNEYVEVVSEDVNGQEIFRQRFKTNKYGSLSGSFVLPKSGITGTFRIYSEADTDSDTAFWDRIWNEGNYHERGIRFNVEEYKRPTFEIAFEDIRESFSFGDSVQVTGKAASFMGAPLSNARLEYKVTRQKLIYTWWGRPRMEDPVLIKSDSLTTDAQGEFTLKFPAEISQEHRNDEDLVYLYSIEAEVTDVSGETRQGSTSLKLGNKNLLLDLQLPENIGKQDTLKIGLSATNLNEQAVPVSGILKVYKLKGPERILRERLWEAPEIQQIPEAEFRELFPEEPYESTLPPEEWPKAELLYETEFSDTELFKTEVVLTEAWSSGKYLVEVSASSGSTAETGRRSFNVVDPDDTYLPDNQRFSASIQNSDYKEDGRIELLVQTAYRDLNLQISVYDGYKTLFDSFVQVNGKKEFMIPLAGALGKELQIQLYALKNNSVIRQQMPVDLGAPARSLSIETESFRNRIEPGVEETWSFKISDPEGGVPEAEVLASMYDASLDQFRSPYMRGDWHLDPGFVREYRSFPGLDILRVGEVNPMNDNFPYISGYSELRRNFDSLYLFGFDFSEPNSWSYRNYLQRLKKGKINNSLVGNTRGRVTNPQGMPLPGVNILIKGSSTGTQTGFDGEFALDTEKGDLLVFSFLGFETVEFVVQKEKEIFIVMEEDKAVLEEVVVMGYGIQEVEQAEAEYDISPPPPVTQALAGKVAGVEIQRDNSSAPVLYVIRGATWRRRHSPVYCGRRGSDRSPAQGFRHPERRDPGTHQSHGALWSACEERGGDHHHETGPAGLATGGGAEGSR